jgi:hypothetical protein
MAVTLVQPQDVSGNLITLTISGRLGGEDYLQFVPILEKSIREHGKIRILLVMKDFHGWGDVSGVWQEIKFDLKHFAHVERVAMVGDKTWEHWMAEFCRPFTTAQVRYFDITELEEARQWIGTAVTRPL